MFSGSGWGFVGKRKVRHSPEERRHTFQELLEMLTCEDETVSVGSREKRDDREKAVSSGKVLWL